jgi:hypothetical protein
LRRLRDRCDEIIPDGALIELDGDTGAVTILDVAPDLATTAA